MAKKVSEYIELQEQITVTPDEIVDSLEALFEKPEIIRITVVSDEKKKTLLLANVAAKIFAEQNKKNVQAELRNAVEFLEKELRKSKEEMIGIQRSITDLKRERKIVDIEMNVENALKMLSDFEIMKKKAETDLEEKTALLNEIQF